MPALTLSNLLAYWVQVAVLVAIGATLPSLVRLSEPRARLMFFRSLLLLCLLLPFVPGDRLNERAFAARASGGPAVGPSESSVQLSGGSVATGAFEIQADAVVPWLVSPLLTLVALGTLGRLAWLGLGLLSLGRLRRAAQPLSPRPSAVDEAVAKVGVAAEFRVSSIVTQPATFGARKPIVLVPQGFTSLSAHEQLAIACHELVHIRRHDWLQTVGEELVRAALWFHPAIWWLLDRVQLSREQLVDRVVIELTGSRRGYLDTLVKQAASIVVRPLPVATAYLRASHFKQRVTALMKETPMSRPQIFTSLFAMALAIFVSGAIVVQAVPLHSQRSTAPTGGPTQTARPGIPTSNPTGPCSDLLQDCPSSPAPTPNGGDTQTPRPGMPTPAPAPTPDPSGPRAQRNLRILQRAPVIPPPDISTALTPVVIVRATVGPDGNVLDVEAVRGAPELVSAALASVRQWRFQAVGETLRTLVGLNLAAPNAAAAPVDPLPVGGDVKPPVKVKNVRPTFPQEAMDAKIQGWVILEIMVGADGITQDATVLRSVAGLDEASLESVLLWEFTPTIAEGTPSPVAMAVTVNFTLR